MDPMTWLTVIAPAALLLIGCGVGGSTLAQRAGMPRLVGAVLAGLLVGPSVLGRVAPDVHRHLFIGASQQHVELTDAQRQAREAIEAAEASGVSESYVEGLRRQHEDELAALNQSVDTSQTKHQYTLAIALGMPALLAAVVFTLCRLLAGPVRGDAGGNLLIMFAGMLISAAATAGVGLWLINGDWVALGELEPRTYLMALCLATALPAVPHRVALQSVVDHPLWRWVFEPLVCALAGAQVALIADFNWLLVLMALFLFGDFKSAGAMFAVRGMRGGTWRAAMKSAGLVAAGNPLSLAAISILHLTGLLTGEATTALVLANMICAALTAPLMRMIDEVFPASDQSSSGDSPAARR